jgi:peptidoglycan/xylan/chitin deacetylase (PgdA/CDA1 family)
MPSIYTKGYCFHAFCLLLQCRILLLHAVKQQKELKNYDLPVLLYHRIVHNKLPIGKHKIYVWENEFEKQMHYLHSNGYETITFYDVLKNPTMDWTKKIILTFDDGYVDNYSVAFPVLKKYGFKAVIYLVTQKKFNEWGVREGEPRLEMMTPAQLKELSDYGIELGGHTQTHIDLSRHSKAEQEAEIRGSKRDVENTIGKEIVSFAYPFGGINDGVKEVTKNAGYRFAVSTNTGPKKFGDDPFQIRRIEIAPKTIMWDFKDKVSGHFFKPNFFRSFFAMNQRN